MEVIAGLAVGFEATCAPTIVVVAAIYSMSRPAAFTEYFYVWSLANLVRGNVTRNTVFRDTRNTIFCVCAL